MAEHKPSGEVTRLLSNWSKGDSEARDAVFPLVYDELRKLAASYLRRERSDHTLQATALVHEAYMRLVEHEHANFQNRQHFFGASAQLMRRILVDHARGRLTAKRGSASTRVELTEAIAMSQDQPAEMLALDESLTRLASLDSQQARVVELRVFAGMSVEETAEVMSISPATVKREWALAKAWLLRQMQGNHGHDA
jgi:RNA polymerase sigma-70 factor, ECF subfamily